MALFSTQAMPSMNNVKLISNSDYSFRKERFDITVNTPFYDFYMFVLDDDTLLWIKATNQIDIVTRQNQRTIPSIETINQRFNTGYIEMRCWFIQT
mmetsp:Transcript_8134/g.12469  ORF Transcript_8134/g.12469 Transcript_8134/m.12469 type:complete len:96 (-) Transcript_8134:1863-2150(-)